MKWNEELYAQSETPMVPGLIVVLDLDKFEEYVKHRGLDPYKPNIVSGELTRLIEEFAWKYRGVVVYGLDPMRGTEEALIEIPYSSEMLESVVKDLEYIKARVEEHGVSLSAVVIMDYVPAKPARSRREAYHGTPGRRRAWKELRRLKRKGGGKIVVLV
ncbi:MAG: hypothetical protein QXJ18_01690 [Desulfurococcaceae archaeon]